jgi:hypothetical protein
MSRTIPPFPSKSSWRAQGHVYFYFIKGKGKFYPRTGHEDPEVEKRNRCTLPLTSALYVGSQRHAPAALPTRKTPYPLYRRKGGPHGRSGRWRKISSSPGFDPRTVRILSRYTFYFIVHKIFLCAKKCLEMFRYVTESL